MLCIIRQQDLNILMKEDQTDPKTERWRQETVWKTGRKINLKTVERK